MYYCPHFAGEKTQACLMRAGRCWAPFKTRHLRLLTPSQALCPLLQCTWLKGRGQGCAPLSLVERSLWPFTIQPHIKEATYILLCLSTRLGMWKSSQFLRLNDPLWEKNALFSKILTPFWRWVSMDHTMSWGLFIWASGFILRS